MLKLPLYRALIRHKKAKKISFHTPGHKNKNKIINQKIYQLDYTELPDTDSLYESNDVIKSAEKNMSIIYNTESTIFSAGGCTLCIQTMLKLAVPYGGKVIASRMIHKSAVNTMSLLNAEIVWIMPQIEKDTNNWTQITAEEIEEQLNNHPDTSCVYITSPDYYGHIADIKQISIVCKKHHVPLLVDNAHGSHLKFLSKDIHPITLGADMCADSIHKTLPVLTGGALLHISNKKYIHKAKSEMSIFGSTSPSYPIMASIDLCSYWLNKNGKKAFCDLEKDILKIKEQAKKKGLLDESETSDPIRISINTAKVGLSGHKAAEYFRKNGIEPEMSDNEHVVFIATPMNSKKELLKLKKAIKNIPQKEPIKLTQPILSIPKLNKSLHESIFGNFEQIDVKKSLGRTSARTVCPCPPGIPVLVPGEIINENSIKILVDYGIFLIDVLK